MSTVYGLLGILFALVIRLIILVIKYRCDVDFLVDMFKVNNGYVKDCEKSWSEAIKLCKDVCRSNEDILRRYGVSEENERKDLCN